MIVTHDRRSLALIERILCQIRRSQIEVKNEDLYEGIVSGNLD